MKLSELDEVKGQQRQDNHIEMNKFLHVTIQIDISINCLIYTDKGHQVAW